MRVTNEQAMKIKSLCRKESPTDSCNGCRYTDNSYDYCPSTWDAPSLAADLLEAQELIKEMRSFIEMLETLNSKEFNEHVRLLEKSKEYAE